MREVSRSNSGFWTRAYQLYRDGFRNLSPRARTLWLIIAIKLVIMFAILKPLFFPNFVKKEATKEQISQEQYVGDELIGRGSIPTSHPDNE